MSKTINLDKLFWSYNEISEFSTDKTTAVKLLDLMQICKKIQEDSKTKNVQQYISKVLISKNIFLANMQKLDDVLCLVTKQVNLIDGFAEEYDPTINTHANGYRSFIFINGVVADTLIKLLIKHQETTQKQKYIDSVFIEEVRYWVMVFDKLSHINSFLIEIQRISSQNNYIMFPDTPDIKAIAGLENISNAIALEDVSIFFEQGVGFHINEEPRNVIKTFVLGQAFLSDSPFFTSRSFLHTLYSQIESFCGIKYMFNSKYLAAKILSNAREQQLSFCKKFFNCTEWAMVHRMNQLSSPLISTNVLITISPNHISIKAKNNKIFDVPIPESYLGKKSLNIRLLSNFRTNEMAGDCSCYTKRTCSCRRQCSPSRDIIFHVHGSAFVAQTSKSHETYLKHWAKGKLYIIHCYR